MTRAYDPENIFAKIIRGEIPNNTVVETDHTLAFRDIQPQAPVHVLVIPKGPYIDHADFTANASDTELVDFARVSAQICASEGVMADGFRTISNAGLHGVQEVPHYHLHILGGRPLGRMLGKVVAS
ncbi:MAG: histidine triad nucleotide-binding protein [Roseovarius sp.]